MLNISRNRYRLMPVFLGLLLLWSCGKDPLGPDVIEPPQLMVSGTLDGIPLNWAVGTEGVQSKTYNQDVGDERFWSFSMEDTDRDEFTQVILFVKNHTTPFGPNGWEDIRQTIKTGRFDFLSTDPPASNPDQASHVGLVYVNKENKLYNTALLDQQNSKFEIQSIEEIQNGNERFLKATLSVDCQLVNIQGNDTLNLSGVQAVVLFGGL